MIIKFPELKINELKQLPNGAYQAVGYAIKENGSVLTLEYKITDPVYTDTVVKQAINVATEKGILALRQVLFAVGYTSTAISAKMVEVNTATILDKPVNIYIVNYDVQRVFAIPPQVALLD